MSSLQLLFPSKLICRSMSKCSHNVKDNKNNNNTELGNVSGLCNFSESQHRNLRNMSNPHVTSFNTTYVRLLLYPPCKRDDG